ncbi:potassium channel protein [bacterium]|nr:potassium channel protein [bacterium]
MRPQGARYGLLFSSIGLFAALLGGGTIGYHLIEDWSYFDGFYMTVITITTIGFGELYPLSRDGRIFTVVLALGGVGTVASILSSAASVIISGEFSRAMRGRHMEHDIRKMEGHTILCGCGRTGQVVLEELQQCKEQVLVIDRSRAVCDELESAQVPHICADATHDVVLEQARVSTAKGLISALPDDADNVFVTLTARGMAPSLLIVARAAQKSSERKLIRAGATRVILPNEVGGRHMAHVMLRPETVRFVDELTGLHNPSVGLSEIHISASSSWVGKTLGELHIRSETGLNILAIRHDNGELAVDPGPVTRFAANDVLIVFGLLEKSHALNREFSANSAG